MTKSVISNVVAPPSGQADLMGLFTRGHMFFNATEWADALPGGTRGSAVNLSTTYSQPGNNQPDFEMDVNVRLIGDFEKVGSTWQGQITRAVFQADGDTVAVVKINSGVDLSRVFNIQISGMIWNELTVSGLRGRLSGGDDVLGGSVGDDILNGRGGNDYLSASYGVNKLIGGAGHDRLEGFSGNDTLLGGAGNDILDGRSGSDRAIGGAGRDTFLFDGGVGNDVWTGGKGADKFQMGGWNPFGSTHTNVTVTDFKRGQGDVIDLTNNPGLLFGDADAARYIGKRAFNAEDGVLEIRMVGGLVMVDQNGDGETDLAIRLDGLGTIGAADTSWILLPDGFDFL